MAVSRDKFDQYDAKWTDREYRLLHVLEEIATPSEQEDRTLAAYLADIIDIMESQPVSTP